MRILRALVLLLVFANLLLFAAARGYLGGGAGGEPERLADQLDPHKIVIVQAGPPGDAVQPDAAAPAPAQPEGPAAAAGTAANGAAETCRRFATLPRDKATRIAALAREAKLKVTQKSLDEPSSWWVHIPSQPNREEVDKRIAELRAAGVNDFFVMQDAGPNHFALSLGLFKVERMALDLRDKLRAKGVPAARVSPRESAGGKVALELRGSTAQLDGFTAQLAPATPEPCVAAQ